MKKVLVTIIILSAGFLVFQGCAKKMMDNITFKISPSPVLPSAIGLDYKEIDIVHESRKIRAWFITASKKEIAGNVVILYNGIGDNLSKWIYFQKCLVDSGISSVSFDYGPQDDTTKSKGSSRLSDVKKDVFAIIDKLKKEYGNNLQLFYLGHSIGNAVMLEMYPGINEPYVKGVIICNAFNSMKKWSIDHGKLPRLFAFAFPNYYDNVSNVRKVVQPVLVVHSKADQTNSLVSALEVFKAANINKELVQFDNYKHNDIFKDGNIDYWTPIIQFIKLQANK